ncbi:MAG: hypothetical protein ABII24_03050 [bacterium]
MSKYRDIRKPSIWGLLVRRSLAIVGVVVISAAAGLYFFVNFGSAVSDTYTVSSQAEWEAGEYYKGSIDTNSTAGDISINSGAGGTWSADTPGFITNDEGYGLWSYDTSYYGADLTTDGIYVYIITGNRRPYLIRYNPELNTFKMLANAPTAFYYGASILYYDDALYAIDGGEQTENGEAGKHFYKYDIATDTWSRLADAPEEWGLGSDIVSDGNGTIYAARGRSTATFWSYTIATDTWDDTIPAIPGYQVYTTTGHALEYVDESYGDPAACAQGCVFAMRGNGNREFFRYDIAESQWYTATTIPSALGGPHYGGSMAYDPTDGYVYLLRGYNTDDFFKYDVDSETWDTDLTDTPDAPGTVYGGGSLLRYGNYLYAIRGNNTPEFWRYDLTDEHWDSISTPLNVGNSYEGSMISFVPNGGDCADATGCLFIAQGENTTTFWRYDINDHAWTTLNVIPGGMRDGSSICYNGSGTIYALSGNNSLSFYGYNISVGTWGTLTSLPATHSTGTAGSLNARYGGGITCLGTTVYAQKGNNNNHFFSYDGSWSEETAAPYAIYAGGAITNDGTYTYSLMGYWRSEFHRYQPGVGWTALASLPTSTYYADDIVYDGTNYIYTASGDYRNYFWRYSISEDTWERSIDFPERTSGYGTGITYDTGTDTLYALRGFNTTSIYKADMSTNQYADSATWISDTLDLNWVESFTTFTATDSAPGASSIAYASRSSTDRVNWSSWATIAAGSISSPARRYVQIRVTLTSDGTNTPTVSDFTITYEKDSDDPANPTITGYSDSGQGTSITTGNSYHYPNPYFSLSGATDASSGVAGYYVQWTTNSSADPSSSEDYWQTSTTFEVNTDMIAGTTYYLRIVTKDNAGNTSSAASAFTYTYSGVSPAATRIWTDQADFEAAGATSSHVNTAAATGTAMTLSSISEGLWMDLPATFGDDAYNQTTYNDSAMAFDGNDTIYALRAVNTKNFYKYTISTKTWMTLTSVTSTANAYTGATILYIPNGSQCADASGCVFALVGNGSTEFLRYDVGADSWTSLTAYGGTGVGYGGAMVWNGGDYIFAYRSNNSTEFYRYSISVGTWTSRSSPAYAFNHGSAAVFVANGTYCDDVSGCIYALRGGSTSQFLRYDVGANTWTNLTAIPFYVQYGGALVYNNGTIYATRGYASDNFFTYDIANDRWDPIADLPSTHYYGSTAGMVYDISTDIIYMFRGYNEYSFYSYDVRNDKWLNTGIPHDQTSNGFYYGGISYDGNDTLYYARGNNTTDFYKYTISTGVHERLMDAPIPMYISADVVYKNGKVYAAGSYNKDSESKMYIYDVAANAWSTSENAAPAWLGYGANLVDGEDGYIYTARGQNTTSFYRYEIASNTWDIALNVIPGAVYQGGCAVMANDGGTDYIYQIRAQNTADIFRFNIGTQTWDVAATLTDAPGNIYLTDACAYDGNDLIYVPRGNTGNTDFYVYSISTDTWETGGDIRSTNDEIWYLGALETGTNGILYGFRGYNTSAMTRYVPSSASTGFESNGTWTSEILDLGSIYDFGGLTVNDSVANNTSLKYETRSCSDSGCAADADDVNWSGWDEVSNQLTYSTTDYYTINSTPAQYVQVRVTFATDQIYTPTVNDLTLSSYSDDTAPTNPDTLTALNQVGGSAITTGNWYNYSTPYFSWTGAADNAGGIGIEGYYVYFGTTADADPETLGTLQSAATYTASGLSTYNTYYLRIKTRDYGGNISSIAWAPFTYSLDNVAPARPTNLASSPAVPSAANSFNIFWTAGSDSGGSPSFQYCYKRYFSDDIQDASDTCISSSQTSLLGIEALTEGVNYFKIRTKDLAGNYSNGGEYESVAYRWAQTPPSLPLNVEHGAVEGDAYSHTFAWSEPISHAFDIGAYCYQINEVPTASYCTNSTYGRWTTSGETAGRFLAAFRTPNTQPGTNYFYVVAKDEAGLVDWDAEYDCDTGQGCITFESNTISPNTPQNFALFDASDRAAETFRLTLGWKAPADNSGSVLYKYKIYRSTDGENFEVRESLLNVDGQDEYAYTDVSLSNATTYYYKVTASDLAGAESDFTTTLSMKPEGKFINPPNLVGSPGIQPRIRSAVITWLTDSPDTHAASSFVRYGTETGVYTGEQGYSDLTGTHTVTLIDLEPDTTYYFKLKWVDIDGNIGYSPEYSLATNDAPSAPTGLSVDPEYAKVNRFTFDWEPPADEGVTISGYFYSVNNVPNEMNTNFVIDSEVGPIAAATQQGINTFYITAVDDFGNVNYANYSSIEFEVNTEPPGEPQALNIIDSSDRDAERYNITLTWDPPANVVQGTANISAGLLSADDISYTIYRSENDPEEEDSGEFDRIASLTSTGYLDTQLDNEIEYHYKVTASDSAGAQSAATEQVSEIPEGRYTTPPDITVAPSVTPDSFSATVVWETERVTSSFIEFGLTSALGEEQGTSDLIEKHEVTVTGLQPLTTYYYRAKVIDIDENVNYSSVGTFTTLEAPRVLDAKITDIKLFDAVISWTTNKETTTELKYGTTTDYGLSVSDTTGSYSFSHTIKLEGLADGTTYNVQLTGKDRTNNPVGSDNYVFITLTFPRILEFSTENIAEGETEVRWTTNVATTSVVEYYNETAPAKTQGNNALVTDHAVLLFGLEDATIYQFVIQGTDQFGYVAESDEGSFRTLEDTTPPVISKVKVESNTIGSGDASRVQIIYSYSTNEPTTTQAIYGQGTGGDPTNETELNGELVFDHLGLISDLEPARTYILRVIAVDKAGNESVSDIYTVLSARKRESFLQLVISNLEQTFSWLGNISIPGT